MPQLTNGSMIIGSAEDAAKAAAASLANSSDNTDADGASNILPESEVSAHDQPDVFGGASEEEVRNARRQGWTENYRGDPKDFVTAKEFYDRGVQINPILRARVGPLEAENARLKAALAQTNKQVSALETKFNEGEDQKRSRRLAELRAAKKVAIDESNGDRVVEIDDELAELSKVPTQPAPAGKGTVDVDPAILRAAQTFQDTHGSWYGPDERKTALTNVIAKEILTDTPSLKGTSEFFSELDRRVRQEFKLATATASASVENGGSNGLTRTTRGKTWNDIPMRDREAAEHMIRQKLFKDRAEYAESYFSQTEGR